MTTTATTTTALATATTANHIHYHYHYALPLPLPPPATLASIMTTQVQNYLCCNLAFFSVTIRVVVVAFIASCFPAPVISPGPGKLALPVWSTCPTSFRTDCMVSAWFRQCHPLSARKPKLRLENVIRLTSSARRTQNWSLLRCNLILKLSGRDVRFYRMPQL